MSPYMQNVVDIQAREARRQADIGRTAEQARLTQAGAYGGSRQAIMEAERQRNLNEQIGDIQAKGLQSAYDRAVEQRLKEGDLGIRGLTGQLQGAQTLGTLGQSQFGQGLQALQEQRLAGKEQRQIHDGLLLVDNILFFYTYLSGVVTSSHCAGVKFNHMNKEDRELLKRYIVALSGH